jgi:hypothetical protein
MKITEQDIVRTARKLRDEENQQLNVEQWNSHRRSSRGFAIPTPPAWFVAIPAAAIVGFMLGFWTNSSSKLDSTLTAIVDTVYIKVHDPQPQQDTIAQPPRSPQKSQKPQSSQKPQKSQKSQPTTVGRPVANDNIRYDLLVRN